MRGFCAPPTLRGRPVTATARWPCSISGHGMPRPTHPPSPECARSSCAPRSPPGPARCARRSNSCWSRPIGSPPRTMQTIALADAVHATYYLGDARTASTLADRLDALREEVRGAACARAGADGDGHGADARRAGRRRRHPCRGAAARVRSRPQPRPTAAVVAAARTAVPAGCDQRRAAAHAGRRGARCRRDRRAACGALPRRTRSVDDRSPVGAGRGQLHRGHPARDRDRSGDRARDVARRSRVARLARGASGRLSCARRAGTRALLRPRHPRRRGVGRSSRWATSSCRSVAQSAQSNTSRNSSPCWSDSASTMSISRRRPSSSMPCCGSAGAMRLSGSRRSSGSGPTERDSRGRALGRTALSGWWWATTGSTRDSSPPSGGTSRPSIDSRRLARGSRTGHGCAEPLGGSMRGCSCAARSTSSPSSAPRSGRRRRQAS